jgi:hypothetical protein
MYKILFGTESLYFQDGEEIVKGNKLHEIIENLANGVYKVGKEETLEKLPTRNPDDKYKMIKSINYYVMEK